MNINDIQDELLKLMIDANNNNEVPVSALIVKDNKIISKKFNKVNSTNNIMNHAEILVIEEASKILKNWRLNDCILYVSLEPCNMCKEVIKMSRINKVIFFSKQNNEKTNSDINYEFISNNKMSNYLKDFFKNKR